jgi:HPt (histidine-containing phosphotransfer) domain-containing protein
MSTAAFERLLSEVETALALGRSIDDLDSLFGNLVQRAMEQPEVGPDLARLTAAAWKLSPELGARPAAQRVFDDLTAAMRALIVGGRANVPGLVEAADAALAGAAPVAGAPVPEPEPEPDVPVFDDGDRALISEFILESAESMDAAEQSMLRLEDHEDFKEQLGNTFRAFHSVKGVAGFLRLNTVTQLAHAIESLMDRARKGEIHPDGPFVDIVLRGIDRIRQMLAWLEPQAQAKPAPGPCPPHADLVTAALGYQSDRAPAEPVPVAEAVAAPAVDIGAETVAEPEHEPVLALRPCPVRRSRSSPRCPPRRRRTHPVESSRHR